jgi:hypothetical protein
MEEGHSRTFTHSIDEMMKYNLIGIFVFLILVLTGTEVGAFSRTNANKNQRLNYANASAASRSESKAIVAKIIRPGSSGQQQGTQNGDGPQIQQTPDAAMNATGVTATQTLLLLVAVIHPILNTDGPGPILPRLQFPLHRILFRVIISPNAP